MLRSSIQPLAVGELRLSELLGSLSFALDMTEGQPLGHCIRCCYVAMRIGEEIGLPEAELGELYYAVLLKDLGCSSNAARICALYLADDLTFKRDFKLVGESLPSVLQFVLGHTGLKAGLAERFRTLLHIVQNGGRIANDLIETRCQRGAEIARQLRFPETVAAAILDLDEHWDGGGKPRGLAGGAIHLHARIALLAQVVDVFRTSAGPAAALEEARRRAGSWFDPALVEALRRVAAQPGFWDELAAPDIETRVFALEPGREQRRIDDDHLDDIAGAFARVVDSKSPFTSGHSARVALFTDMIAEAMDFAPEPRRWLKRCALLHDIGKLGVSNQILDKAGKLDEAEWVAMRRHAAHTETILGRIAAFGDIARIAGAHHERLDGKGYPKGLRADEIALETRIITTADVFDALTAERPYRAAMPAVDALAIMRREIGTAFDPACFDALQAALDRWDQAEPADLALAG